MGQYNLWFGEVSSNIRINETKNGKVYCRFNFWTGSYRKDVADTFPCLAFGDTAKSIVSYVGRGSILAIYGTIKNKTWIDASGIQKNDISFVVERYEAFQIKKPYNEIPPEVPIDEVLKNLKIKYNRTMNEYEELMENQQKDEDTDDTTTNNNS